MKSKYLKKIKNMYCGRSAFVCIFGKKENSCDTFHHVSLSRVKSC